MMSFKHFCLWVGIAGSALAGTTKSVGTASVPKSVGTASVPKSVGTASVPVLGTASVPTPNEAPPAQEAAVLFTPEGFFPNQVRLKANVPARLIFASVNKKPGALIVENLGIQRWVGERGLASDGSEATRELLESRMAEVLVELPPGAYPFSDALSGAVGELKVE
jgi:hypothetical protein